jgi:hypothetical protein
MRISFIIFLLVLPAGCSEGYIEGQNSFGFVMDIPDNWLTLSHEETEELSGGSVKDLPPRFMNQVKQQFKQMMKAGNIEIYFRKSITVPDFLDNVIVSQANYSLPKTEKDLQKVRDALPGELEKKFGRPVDLKECKYAEVGGRNALYLEFEDGSCNKTCMQYQVHKSRRKTILITATCSNDTLLEVRAEFEQMIASIRFP